MAFQGKQKVGQICITLIVQDVAKAVDFYRDVLGAEEMQRNFSYGRTDPPGDEMLSAELKLAGAWLVVGKENPRWRDAPRPDWPRSPTSAGSTSVFLTIYVDDVDEVFARAVALGASPLSRNETPHETYWGDKTVNLLDPFGHAWRLQTRLEDVADADLAARFEAQQARARAERAAQRA